MKKELIQSYRDSYNPHVFAIINNDGDYHYSEVINTWKKNSLKELNENQNLAELSELLGHFIIGLRDLMIKTIDLYKEVDNQRNLPLKFKSSKILDQIEYINQFEKPIRHIAIKGNSELAYKLKKYCLLLIDECLNIFKSDFGITIFKSPLNVQFRIIKDIFKKSIDIEEVEIMSIKKTNSISEIENPKEIEIPIFPHPSIFKNDIAFLIFQRLFSNYKDHHYFCANFSFVYYAMKRDNYIVCRGVDYKIYLAEEHEVFIDKIDSRQSGMDNKRYNLYKEIKSSTTS